MDGDPAGRRRIRNLGILAHVDAGKTTLTERLLFQGGAIPTPGSVDRGTSRSDVLEVERRRGISVRASTLAFAWGGVRIHLIDTPGHADFSAEVERSLRVLDGAVLVLSAVEGIQAQTETLWRALAALDLPAILFVNKIDRVGADSARVLAEVRARLSPDVVALNRAVAEGEAQARVAELSAPEAASLMETVAARHDALLERYLAEASIPPALLRSALAECTRDRRLFPALCGAAKTGAGVEALLEAIVAYLPDAPTDAEAPVSGVVFRLDHDPRLGRVAGVRLWAGTLRTRDRVHNATAQRTEQVTQIKGIHLNRRADVGLLRAGEIGSLCGLPEARIGDVLGDPAPVPVGYALSEPLLSVRVLPAAAGGLADLAAALQQLSSEDPHLDFQWHHDEGELHVRIMGAVQTEILAEILRSRFGLEATFGPPTVLYRETPAAAGVGAEAYTMPKPCWAIVQFQLEPGPRGSGVRYRSQVDKADIHPKYQNEIGGRVPHALRQGLKGWQVTDLAVTLTAGSHHLLHSRPGDFKLATDMAILKGLQAAGTSLLEPILAFRITGPEAALGKVTADIVHLRGRFEPAAIAGGQFDLRGRVPLATSMEYAIRLGALTGGRGTLATRFDGYEAVPDELGAVRPYRGISPLDRAKYILWWRGAIQEAITG